MNDAHVVRKHTYTYKTKHSTSYDINTKEERKKVTQPQEIMLSCLTCARTKRESTTKETRGEQKDQEEPMQKFSVDSSSSSSSSSASKDDSGNDDGCSVPHRKTPHQYQTDRDIHNLPDVSKWPNRPIYFTTGGNTKCDLYGKDEALPISEAVDFEGELFKGKFIMRVKNVTSGVPPGHHEYFEGKKRLKQYVIQGRFKERINMSDAYFGDIYEKPLNMSSIVKIVVPIFKRLVPGVLMDLSSDAPRVLALMGGGNTNPIRRPSRR